MTITSRRGGVPPPLAATPLRTFRAPATRKRCTPIRAHSSPGSNAWEPLHRVACGYYVVVPQEHVGSAWMPSLEAAAAGIAAADFGPRHAPLMGISAARIHGAIPRAVSTAVVAVPARGNDSKLLDRPATVQFVKRDTARPDVEAVTLDLGTALVTTPEQTVLDLARRPALGGAADHIRPTVRALFPRCDPELLEFEQVLKAEGLLHLAQ